MNGLGFMPGESGGIPDWYWEAMGRNRGFGTQGMPIPGMGGAIPRQPIPAAMPEGQPQTLGDQVNAQVGRAPVRPGLGQRIGSGFERLTNSLTPVDPRIAATMDPAYLKQMRGQAMLNAGLGMLAASSRGGRFGESAAAGLGQGLGGFGKGIESAYQIGVDEREQKRRDEILTTSNTRYDAEQAYRTARDKVGDERSERDFKATQDYRKESLASAERRATARRVEGTTLTDEAIDLAAGRIVNGEKARDVLANFGRGNQGAANITAVQNRVAQLAQERGMSVSEFAVVNQEMSSQARARLELGAREGKIASRVEEAKQFAKIAGEASLKVPRGKFVPVSRLMQFTDTQLSDPQLAAFKAANVSLINAYAAAVGGGVPTVHDKEAAEAMLSTAQSPEAYQAVVNQLITEMDAALAAPRNVMKEMREHDLGGGLGGHGAPAGGEVIDFSRLP